jgi:hypothetical protein
VVADNCIGGGAGKWTTSIVEWIVIGGAARTMSDSGTGQVAIRIRATARVVGRAGRSNTEICVTIWSGDRVRHGDPGNYAENRLDSRAGRISIGMHSVAGRRLWWWEWCHAAYCRIADDSYLVTRNVWLRVANETWALGTPPGVSIRD